MEILKITSQSKRLDILAELIIREATRIAALKKLGEEKNFLFYTPEERARWQAVFEHTLEIKQAALQRLETRYDNELLNISKSWEAN